MNVYVWLMQFCMSDYVIASYILIKRSDGGVSFICWWAQATISGTDVDFFFSPSFILSFFFLSSLQTLKLLGTQRNIRIYELFSVQLPVPINNNQFQQYSGVSFYDVYINLRVHLNVILFESLLIACEKNIHSFKIYNVAFWILHVVVEEIN